MGETWLVTLGHSLTKIWVKRGWRRFKYGNNLVVGDRRHFKLIDTNEVIELVYISQGFNTISL